MSRFSRGLTTRNALEKLDVTRIGKFQYMLNLEIQKTGQGPTLLIAKLMEQVKIFYGCHKAVFIPIDTQILELLKNDIQTESKLSQYVCPTNFLDKDSKECFQLI